MKVVSKFIRLSNRDKSFFAEALIMIVFTKVWLTLLPFRSAIKILKRYDNLEVNIIHESNKRELVNTIKYSVGRANYLAFWKNICLVRSFAAKIMLDRRGIPSVIYFGLQFGKERELAAHAWLKCGDIYVTPRGSLRFTKILSL